MKRELRVNIADYLIEDNKVIRKGDQLFFTNNMWKPITPSLLGQYLYKLNKHSTTTKEQHEILEYVNQRLDEINVSYNYIEPNLRDKATIDYFNQFNEINTLFEYLGYTLFERSNKYKKWVIIIGECNTGKTSFIDNLFSICERARPTRLNKWISNGIGEDQLLYINEVPNFVDTDTINDIKDIVSNNEYIKVNQKCEKLKTVCNFTKLIATINNYFQIPHCEWDKWFERLLIIKFDKVFDNKPFNIEINKNTLYSIAVDAYKQLSERNGFIESEQSKALKQEWLLEWSSFERWYQKEYHLFDKNKSIEQYYSFYEIYCERWRMLPISIFHFEKSLQEKRNNNDK